MLFKSACLCVSHRGFLGFSCVTRPPSRSIWSVNQRSSRPSSTGHADVIPVVFVCDKVTHTHKDVIQLNSIVNVSLEWQFKANEHANRRTHRWFIYTHKINPKIQILLVLEDVQVYLTDYAKKKPTISLPNITQRLCAREILLSYAKH